VRAVRAGGRVGGRRRRAAGTHQSLQLREARGQLFVRRLRHRRRCGCQKFLSTVEPRVILKSTVMNSDTPSVAGRSSARLVFSLSYRDCRADQISLYHRRFAVRRLWLREHSAHRCLPWPELPPLIKLQPGNMAEKGADSASGSSGWCVWRIARTAAAVGASALALHILYARIAKRREQGGRPESCCGKSAGCCDTAEAAKSSCCGGEGAEEHASLNPMDTLCTHERERREFVAGEGVHRHMSRDIVMVARRRAAGWDVRLLSGAAATCRSRTRKFTAAASTPCATFPRALSSGLTTSTRAQTRYRPCAGVPPLRRRFRPSGCAGATVHQEAAGGRRPGRAREDVRRAG
jgi:hypothetical protein